MKMRNLTAAVASACVLAACTPGMNAAVESLQKAVQRDPGASRARLNPKFSYLRVTIDGRLAFLALGNVDRTVEGAAEVWYSASREVVRLQDGRVVGATGLKTEWRNVSVADAPSWLAAANAGMPLSWVRVRDVMPGYRYGVRDELVLRVIPAPARSNLFRVDPQSLVWFEERIEPEARGGRLASLLPGATAEKPLPPARYAVDLRGGKEIVVYGEQCIAPDICFSWQRWSAGQQNEALKGEGSAQ